MSRGWIFALCGRPGTHISVISQHNRAHDTRRLHTQHATMAGPRSATRLQTHLGTQCKVATTTACTQSQVAAESTPTRSQTGRKAARAARACVRAARAARAGGEVGWWGGGGSSETSTAARHGPKRSQTISSDLKRAQASSSDHVDGGGAVGEVGVVGLHDLRLGGVIYRGR